ncbi:NUDIX hydrolase [Nocardia transvalensis]|uniref:NUDIX hydrolase n=1 Tax=Nocardia transvalensis TaxID=37333 RepID=UPI0005954C6D|nr:NUDIX domain-containing protein [Nocardia transvalensis]
MTFSATTILVLALIAALIVAAGGWAYATANRLDRLHVRGDQARHALEAALARRAVVARSVSLALTNAAPDVAGEQARRLHGLADRAERADWSDRETAENQLAAALSSIDISLLPPQLVAELADAEARVLIARRFHNDAVRDTLALRTRRPVRLLHLGGTAPLPTYFEISERVTPAASTGLEVDTVRTSARVVLLDDRDRVLLMRGHDPRTPDVPFWFTVGGGIEPGETLRTAAVREVWEETGRAVDSTALRGPIWRRVAVFPFDGELVRSEELFFVARIAAFEPKAANPTVWERRCVTANKWCTAEDIAELDGLGETVYPYHLDQLLAEAAAVAASDTEPEVRSIR